jgi:hypothetical protein
MPVLKIIWLAKSARRGWKLIPPEQRRMLLRGAQSTARKHGPIVAKTLREQSPVVARRLAESMRQRKPRP